MERFAIINVESVNTEYINKICRLCGLENDQKIKILGNRSHDDDEEEPLENKIDQCVGIKVKKNDKMPPMICILCSDKINDFFEYRSMCKATNSQTREALGLPVEEEEENLLQPIESTYFRYEEEISKTKKGKLKTENELLVELKVPVKRERGREAEDTKWAKKRKELSPPIPITSKKMKITQTCKICDEGFGNVNELDAHFLIKHIPSIRKYGCLSCKEGFESQKEYQSHLIWHSHSATKYKCHKCRSVFTKVIQFTKHFQADKCAVNKNSNILPDIKCQKCNKKFLTQNLYEWHSCFIKTRGACLKCGRAFLKKSALFKHYVLCEEAFPQDTNMPDEMNVMKKRGRPKKKKEELSTIAVKVEPNSILDLGNSNYDTIMATATATAKAAQDVVENGTSSSKGIDAMNNLLSTVSDAIAKLSSANSMSKKKKKKKDKTINEVTTEITVKQEPNVVIENDDEENENFNEESYNNGDDNYDDHQNQDDYSDNDDDNTENLSALEPNISINIKAENLSRGYADESENMFDAMVARNIKKESGLQISPSEKSNKIVPKITIKKEKGTLNASVINNTQPKQKKPKLFRNPLAIRIKQEKKDDGFPTAERPTKQLQNPFSIRIKQEPMHTGYGDQVNKSVPKIRINPLSVAHNNATVPKIVSVVGQADLDAIGNYELPMVQIGSGTELNVDAVKVKKEVETDEDSAEEQRDETEDNEMGDEELIRQDELREEEEKKKKINGLFKPIQVKVEIPETAIEETEETEMGDEELIMQDLVEEEKRLNESPEKNQSVNVETENVLPAENKDCDDKLIKLNELLSVSEDISNSDEISPAVTENDELDLDSLLKNKIDEISQSSNSQTNAVDQALNDELNLYLDSEINTKE